MRIGLIQLNAKIGDFENNRKRIEQLAESQPADLYIAPELALSGYHVRDLFARAEFLAEEARQLQKLCEWSQRQSKAIWIGHTLSEDGPEGGRLYNAASLIENGAITAQICKHKLPTYNIFEEARYFTPGATNSAGVTFRGHKLHVEICEDSWSKIQRFAVDEWHRYPASPAVDCDLFINLSASPFVLGKCDTRRELLANLARQHRAPVIYANFSGAQDELLFDGQSSVYNAKGDCVFEAPAFAEGLFVVDLGAKPASPRPTRDHWQDLHGALCTYIRDYVIKSGFQKVILGLSGGIDSALVAALCADALGPANVLGVGLATQWTSELSKTEAKLLAQNLGIEFRALEIDTGLRAATNVLNQPLSPLSQENIQSRLRGLLLMTLANEQRRLLISTANKSEVAMGYSTLYGDMCGAIMPLGDLYKTEVYGLAHHINHSAGYARIPHATLTRAPSAELAPGQQDSDSLPEYPKLDAFLKMYLEYRNRLLPETEKWNKFLAPHTVSGLVRKIEINEFKRAQAPLIAKVHHRSFGKHWNLPIAKATGLLEPTL